MLSVISLLPKPAAHPWTVWPRQPFFSPANIRLAVRRDINVIVLPYSWAGPDMAWQIDAGLWYRQAGGNTGFVPLRERPFGVVNELLAGSISGHFLNDLRAFCATHSVRDIFVGPGTAPAVVKAVKAEGWPVHRNHGVRIVSVPRAMHLSYYLVRGDYWPSSGQKSWIGRRVSITTRLKPLKITLYNDRPLSGNVHVIVKADSGSTEYSIKKNKPVAIKLPANSTRTIYAENVFVPERWIHNNDSRRLSVAMSIAVER